MKKSGFLAIMVAVIFAAIGCDTPGEKLKFLGPKLPAAEGSTDSVYKSISDFSFTNQNGKTVSRSDYNDKIWVADVFFTSCPGICPKLTKGFTEIQEAFKDDPDFMLLSITVDPEKDSVEVLRSYADQHGAIDGKWHMVTGNKKDLYEFAHREFFFKAFEGEGGELGFVHDQAFRLMDKDGRMRGSWHYDGTRSSSVDSLIADIKLLKSEYQKAE